MATGFQSLKVRLVIPKLDSNWILSHYYHIGYFGESKYAFKLKFEDELYGQFCWKLFKQSRQLAEFVLAKLRIICENGNIVELLEILKFILRFS